MKLQWIPCFSLEESLLLQGELPLCVMVCSGLQVENIGYSKEAV